MKNFSTWLLVIFMVMFWIFRAIVSICTQYNIEFSGFIAYNLPLEITLLFVTLLSIILVVKRKFFGGILYFITYGGYFGQHLIPTLITIFTDENSITTPVMMNTVADLAAILIAFFVIIDLMLDHSRKINPSDGKTDWYFKNKKYDEELASRDQREDNNEYKFY